MAHLLHLGRECHPYHYQHLAFKQGILRDESFSPSLLLPQSESTSSIKIIEGFFSLAILNKVLIRRSDSPIHLLTRSDELIEKNVPSHSVAQALARKDLPVPGGPYKRIPLHG